MHHVDQHLKLQNLNFFPFYILQPSSNFYYNIYCLDLKNSFLINIMQSAINVSNENNNYTIY